MGSAFRAIRRRIQGLFALAWVLALVAASIGELPQPAVAAGITLTPVGVPFTNPISVDYHQPTNKLLLSVNYSSGQPNNFDLVAANGTFTQFSSIKGLTDEVYIAAIRQSSCQGGFTVGEAFTGTGVPGQIARIAPDGSSAQIPWVTLPGENGLLRGGLFQDRYCAFGGNLIVVTDTGNVWEVTSAGVPTRIAAGVSSFLEGVVTVPNQPATYGPWAGKILAGDEQNGCVYAVDFSGVTPYCTLGIGEPENFAIIPANENFYGVAFSNGQLLSAGASQWTPYVGDLAIVSESPGIVWDVHWNGSNFVLTNLAQVGQWEGFNFAPVSLPNVAPTCNLTGVGTNGSGQKFIQITVQDTGSGLAGTPNGIVVTSASNVAVTIPSYSTGTTSAVVVTATKVNQSQGSEVALKITDVAGNATSCDPVLSTLGAKSGAQVFRGLSQGESQVQVHNGAPGLAAVAILANGHLFAVRHLQANETRTVSVATAMHAGTTNTLVVRGFGPRDGSADLVISDGSGMSQASHLAASATNALQAQSLLDWLGASSH